MNRIAASAVAALMLSGAGAISAAARLDKHVTLTGCVVKGDGGYVLMNTTDGESWETRSSRVPAGTSVAGRTFYWLDNDHRVKDHAGQKVELSGELAEDVDLGQVKAEREGGDVELRFKVDSREIKVKVPDTPGAVATSGVTDDERKTEFVVRKIDVKSVKMLASTCQ